MCSVTSLQALSSLFSIVTRCHPYMQRYIAPGPLSSDGSLRSTHTYDRFPQRMARSRFVVSIRLFPAALISGMMPNCPNMPEDLGDAIECVEMFATRAARGTHVPQLRTRGARSTPSFAWREDSARRR